MRSKLIPIGNSRGVRIPKPLLTLSELGDEIEIIVRRGKIIIVSAEPLRRLDPGDAALLSEPALAADWNRPEEDEAWKDL